MKKASERRMSRQILNGQTSMPFELEKDSKAYTPCYLSHPPLKLTGDLVVHGGSCHSPVVKDADIYVGLDHSMTYIEKAYPWEPGFALLYPITDHSAPKDVASFTKLIDYLAEQIVAGSKVHAGCIGGHGRTGTLFAALVKVMLGEVDAISYVREHYCVKSVESDSQVKFLNKHFGVKKVASSKPLVMGYASTYNSSYSGYGYTFDNGRDDVVAPLGVDHVWGDRMPPWD
jgi:protein-tyrosine phosphatase